MNTEDPYRERPDSLPSTHTPLIDRLFAWFEVHHAKVAKRVGLSLLLIWLITWPIVFGIVVALTGALVSIIAAGAYVLDEDDRVKTLLVCLCSLAVAVLSGSALYLCAPAPTPAFEITTEDECECCVEAKPDAGAES